MSEKQGIATNKRIIDVLTDYRSKSLVLRPRFQRNLVWNIEHKVSFLDTILRNLPFPEVYFCDGDLDLKAQKTTTWVVDGQQRLNTIFDYVDGNIDLSKQNITPFSELTGDKQRDFLNYAIVVRSLGSQDEQQIKEIFQRINSVGYALNSVEIDNALYEGDFISIAKELVATDDFKQLEILTEQEVSRMKDIEFLLLVLASIELGRYFTQDKELQEVIKRYDDEYPNRIAMKSAVERALQILANLALPYDSLWFRKTSMFTLLVEVGKYCLANPNKDLDLENFSIKLTGIEMEIIKSKTENPDTNRFAKYYKYMFQQTTSRAGRIARGLIVAEIL